MGNEFEENHESRFRDIHFRLLFYFSNTAFDGHQNVACSSLHLLGTTTKIWLFYLHLYQKCDGSKIPHTCIRTVVQTKNETPLFNSIQNIVQKWNWYQSSWINFLLQFDALKFFLGVSLHGRLCLSLIFSKVNSQIFQRNRKVHLSNCLETNFHSIFKISC